MYKRPASFNTLFPKILMWLNIHLSKFQKALFNVISLLQIHKCSERALALVGSINNQRKPLKIDEYLILI